MGSGDPDIMLCISTQNYDSNPLESMVAITQSLGHLEMGNILYRPVPRILPFSFLSIFDVTIWFIIPISWLISTASYTASVCLNRRRLRRRIWSHFENHLIGFYGLLVRQPAYTKFKRKNVLFAAWLLVAIVLTHCFGAGMRKKLALGLEPCSIQKISDLATSWPFNKYHIYHVLCGAEINHLIAIAKDTKWSQELLSSGRLDSQIPGDSFFSFDVFQDILYGKHVLFLRRSYSEYILYNWIADQSRRGRPIHPNHLAELKFSPPILYQPYYIPIRSDYHGSPLQSNLNELYVLHEKPVFFFRDSLT